MAQDVRIGSTNNHDPQLKDRPIAELMRELADETTTLVRQELELAKAEMTQKGKQAGLGMGMFGASGIVGLFALGAVTASFIAALALTMPVWTAALTVAVAYAVIAGIVALVAKARLREATPPTPEQTVQTVKEDVEWVKTQAKSGRR